MKRVDAVRAGRPSDLAEGRLLPDLERARARFSRASDQVGSPVLAPARALP